MDGHGGVLDGELSAFLGCLAVRGRSSYTARSYELGLRDFAGWLQAHGALLAAVGKAEIQAYVGDFIGRDGGRGARTVNHRLSVLSSFFAYLIERDTDVGGGAWCSRRNPVPERPEERWGGIPGGGDRPPRRRRAELRRAEPRELPSVLSPDEVRRLVAAAACWRDRAMVLLLSRSGQRIGDWSAEHGQHGLLGMRMGDVDRRTSTITVLLKGARDQHRVPVSEDFWPAFQRYLLSERADPPTDAVWVGRGRAAGQPLRYEAFAAALRAMGSRAGVPVNAHMFRHTLASDLVTVAGPHVAQRMLGHRHVETTLEAYAHVDQSALVAAVAAVEHRSRELLAATRDGRPPRYAFGYDQTTLDVLEAIATPRAVTGA